MAHALKTLPAIGRAFAEGRLSYSKVRALTRAARPDNEVIPPRKRGAFRAADRNGAVDRLRQ